MCPSPPGLAWPLALSGFQPEKTIQKDKGWKTRSGIRPEDVRCEGTQSHLTESVQARPDAGDICLKVNGYAPEHSSICQEQFASMLICTVLPDR